MPLMLVADALQRVLAAASAFPADTVPPKPPHGRGLPPALPAPDARFIIACCRRFPSPGGANECPRPDVPEKPLNRVR